MQIRVFDCWLHEQDIRDAVGRPGHETGLAVEVVLDEMATALGFAGLAAHGGIAILYVLDAANRAVQRGVARPARELLFTHVRQGHKYKARAFIDTFVYRLGDVLGAQLEALQARGVEIVGIAIRDRPEDVANFLGRYGNPYSRIGSDRISEVQLAIGSSGVPETFVIDAKGVIRYQHIGDIRPEHVPVLLAELEKAR